MEPSTESVANTAVVEGISDSSASGIEHCTKGNYWNYANCDTCTCMYIIHIYSTCIPVHYTYNIYSTCIRCLSAEICACAT